MDYADLTILDMSKANTAEGRAALAVQLREGMSEQGFVYVINHGHTRQQVMDCEPKY